MTKKKPGLFISLIVANVKPIFSGKLRREALPAFLEFMGACNHSGLVELEGPNEAPAQLAFQSGQLVFAVCKNADSKSTEQILKGAEAARAILRWRYAYLQTYDTPLPTLKPNVSGSTMSLMLEAARIEDEMLRERELPSNARIKVRNNISAYEALAAPELEILRHARFGVTVGMLRNELQHLPVDSALLELVAHGVMEIEGLSTPEMHMTQERAFVLSMLVPKRGRAKPNNEKQNNDTIIPFQSFVYSLVDGVRSAEQIRMELNLGPGKLRQVLAALKQTGQIEY